MKNIHEIMFGELRPWSDSNIHVDEYYKPLTRSLNSVQLAFNPRYELKFIRDISSKTQFFKKLIDNDITQYCNSLFNETENASSNRIAYRVNKANRELHAVIIKIPEIIKTQNLDLSQINSPYADFSTDKPFKESTYIIFYLLSALIRCCLEVQQHFLSAIHEDDRMEVADFFTRLLQQQAPINSFISEIETIQIEETPIKLLQNTEDDFATQVLTTKYHSFVNTVSLYQFMALAKLEALNAQGQNELIYLIINKDVPYAVAMMVHLGYLVKLKQDYSLNKEKIYTHLSKALNSNTRTIKGNCLVLLNPNTNEDKYKYPAENYKKETQNDYSTVLAKYRK
ncbi:MAG: hypothetical protein Q8S54_08735 [Bacteroidota bacterium]|nr:hypothetical protein [Bacteroidota bacterium]